MARIEKLQGEDTNEPVKAMGEFKGLKNTVAEEALAPGELVEAVNVDIDDAGKLRRRPGYSQLLDAPGAHSFWSNGTIGFFVAGTTFYRLNEDYTTTSLGTGLVEGAEMAYVEVNGAIFHSNGTQTGAYRNGFVNSWGLPNPGMATYTLVPGSLPAGDYKFVLTYVRNDGFESGASLMLNVAVPADSGVMLNSLPAPLMPDIAQINIYATPQNGEMFYLVASVPRGTLSFQYADTGLDLSRPLMTQFKYKPVPGTALALYNGRIYIVRGDLAYYTQPGNYELMDMRDFLRFNSVIKVFAPVRDGIFVATDRETVFLRGHDASDFAVERIADYGAVSGTLTYGTENTERGVDRVAFWESTQGKVLGITGGTLYNLTHDQFTYSPGSKGASIVLEQSGIRRFISVMQN